MMKTGNDGSRGNETDGRQYGCRFLSAPFPECYCMHITGANIPKILLYCSGEFASCRVYIDNTKPVPASFHAQDRVHHQP